MRIVYSYNILKGLEISFATLNVLAGSAGSQVPIVFVRYSLSCLPLILLLLASAVSGFEDGARRWVPIPHGTTAAFLGVLLLVIGPLPQIYYYPNNWTNHGLFQYCYNPENRKFHYRFITTPGFFRSSIVT